MPGRMSKKVTIIIRASDRSPKLTEFLRFMQEHGARNCFAIHPEELNRWSGAVDAGFGPGHEQPQLNGVVYWIDTPERVERLLPAIREQIPSGLAAVEDTWIAFDSTTSLPDLPEGVTVGDVMTRDPIAVTASDALVDVVELMVRHNIRAVPVLDSDRRVVGIVTNTDLVTRAGLTFRIELFRGLTSEAQQAAIAALDRAQTAGDVMTRAVVTVLPERTVRDAALLMIKRRLKRLPVVDWHQRLVGMVSRFDLLRSVTWLPDAPAESERLPPATGPGSRVRDVMSTAIPEVAADAPLADVLSVLVSTRLHRAIVVDADRHVLGVVSDADLVERLVPEIRPGALSVLMRHIPGVRASADFEASVRHTRGQTARDLMQPNPVVVREGDDLRSVVGPILSAAESKAVPVLDGEDRLVGVIDRAHLLWALLSARPGEEQPPAT